MRLLQYLQEEYVTIAAGYEIFVNPTAKEIRDIKEAFLRCIADFNKKDLYVFSHNLFHADVMRKLVKEKGLYGWADWEDMKSKANNNYAFFTAKLQGGKKLEFYRSDTGSGWGIDIVSDLKWTKMDDSWMSQWFGTGFIKTFLKEIEDPKAWR